MVSSVCLPAGLVVDPLPSPPQLGQDAYQDWSEQYYNERPCRPELRPGASFTETVAHEQRVKQYETSLERWRTAHNAATKVGRPSGSSSSSSSVPYVLSLCSPCGRQTMTESVTEALRDFAPPPPPQATPRPHEDAFLIHSFVSGHVCFVHVSHLLHMFHVT